MKKYFSAGMIILLAASLLLLVNCSGSSTVTVKANKKVVELIKTWDPDITFYTSKKNPLKSVEGLRQEEIGCWGPELIGHIRAFYDAAEIEKTHGEGVQVIGPDNPIFVRDGGPRIYLTSAKNAPRLKEAVKVRFSE